jgi:site-specific recombinase XerC
MDIPLHHFFSSRTDPRTLDVLTRGPLAPYLKAYAQRLHDEGYATQSGESQLRMLAHFNRWLERQRMLATAVTASTVDRYVRARRKGGKLRRGDAAALSRMLGMLRDHPEPGAPPLTALQVVLQQYQHYLRHERSLAAATITNYAPIVAAFLAACFPTGIPDFHRIAASEIADFVRRQADRITTKRATTVVTALRSFLRYLLHRGAIRTDLATCVPTIASWSLSTVPKFLPADQIQRI